MPLDPSASRAANCRASSSAPDCSDLADDQRLPILERCKFVAIFADMMDEFFQVRVVSLEDKVAAGVQTASIDGVRPRQQLAAIRERVLSLVERQDRMVLDALLPELALNGIAIVPYSRPRRRRARTADEVLRRERLSGAHAVGGRSGPPLPDDL